MARTIAVMVFFLPESPESLNQISTFIVFCDWQKTCLYGGHDL